MRFYNILIAGLMLLLISAQTLAQQAPVISDIRVEGLQRISAGTVFTSLPLNVGDTLNSGSVSNAIRTLFRTGNFDDVTIALDGDVLVVQVVERPSINEINLEGNEIIDSESLLDGLKGAGLSEGDVFRRSTLEGMKMELTRQYVSQGRYDANIETEVVSLPRNRVNVNINIDEGTTAAIKHINIVGNRAFTDEELMIDFELSETGWFSWITSDDKYAKERLTGDIEKLSSYYLDRGYIQFAVESTQVTLSPDREQVYITININEGEVYTVADVDLSGDLVIPEDQLRPFIFVRSGNTFSQAAVTGSEEWLTRRLGNDGYNFATVEGIPEINEEEKTVNLKFFIDPGKRTYVRRIGFVGNARTADEVMRREMRQMEGAPASSANIEQSRVRLDRLGYFKETNVETREVPGTDDLIDLEYQVEEQPSGSIGASVGYSQDSGIIFGANLQQDNFLGSGKRVGIGLNKSDYQTSINFSYVNPYYTEDGVSRGFSVFYRTSDYEEVNISSYSTDSRGFSLNFGYPIKETQSLGFSIGFVKTSVDVGRFAVQEIKSSPRADLFEDYYVSSCSTGDFITDDDGFIRQVCTADEADSLAKTGTLPAEAFSEPIGEGFLDEDDDFNDFPFTISWSESTLNRGRLATRGYSQKLAMEITVPGSDLEYFKLTYTGQVFFPLTEKLTLRFRTELGYGDGYGNQERLPFFKNFYAGGFGSVRGFKSNTLGPRSTPADRYIENYPYDTEIVSYDTDVDTDGDTGNDNDLDNCDTVAETCRVIDKQVNPLSYILDPDTGKLITSGFVDDPDPFGGNILVEGGVELLFPLPFIKDQRSVRSAFFIDMGNVFSTYCPESRLVTDTRGNTIDTNCYDLSFDQLRYSFGIGVSWITGFGPLTFSYAKPLNEEDADETEAFQFTLGRSF